MADGSVASSDKSDIEGDIAVQDSLPSYDECFESDAEEVDEEVMHSIYDAVL